MSQLIRRYRRESLIKATKPFTPVFAIDGGKVFADLFAGTT